MRVEVETPADGCVWLRSTADDLIHAEVRLANETVKMTKEVDRASRNSQAAKQAETKKRFDELRRQGHNTPYDPKLEGPREPAPATGPASDRSRAWHGSMYEPISGRDRPVFHARIDRADGCVAAPGEIRSYRVIFASVTAPEAPPRVIPCTGEACADVDASAEQTAACRLANRGKRDIMIGIVQYPNQDVSIQKALPGGGTMSLDLFRSCLKAQDIGRIEARYR